MYDIIRIIFWPLLRYLKNIKNLIFFKYQHPTIKLGPNSRMYNSEFGVYNYISENTTLTNVNIDDFSYIGSNSFLHNVSIGKFTCIGPNVKIGLGEHPTSKFVSIHPMFYSTAKQVGFTLTDTQLFQEYNNTKIGNDVWIGSNAIIRGGISIGNGAVIAAGAVVNRDVEPYNIVGGIPAKVIKKRFTDDIISKLLHFKWWDKDISWLKQNHALMTDITNINLLALKDK